MSIPTIPLHALQKNMTVPRNSRRIDFPIEGIDEQIISDLIPVDAVSPTFPVIGTSTYGDISYAGRPVENPFAGYVLRYIKSEKMDGDYTRMFFGRNIPAAGANVPARSFTGFGDHPWPPILEELRFVKDPTFPHSTHVTNSTATGILNATRIYVREVFIAGAEEGTRFLTEEFVGSEKFAIPRYPVPLPTAVSYDFLGASGAFPKCLHKDFTIKSQNRQEKTFYVADGSNSTSVTKGQFFPKTNFKKWAPYVLSDKQEYKDGLWYRIRIRVYPPPKPKTITR